MQVKHLIDVTGHDSREFLSNAEIESFVLSHFDRLMSEENATVGHP